MQVLFGIPKLTVNDQSSKEKKIRKYSLNVNQWREILFEISKIG